MTLFGPDGSAWQDGIRLTDADAAAIRFLAWRSIHVDGRRDRTFEPMLNWAKARRIPFAAYTYLAADPSQQDEATDLVVPDDIPVMVDWEQSGCTFGEVVRFVEDLRAKGNRVTLLYTGRAFWQANGSPTLTGLGLELVVARYGDQSPTGMYEAEARYAYMASKYSVWDWNLGGLSPVMWQFGSRIRWGDRYMDMNAIRDPAVVRRCFKDWTPPTPPSEDDVLDYPTEIAVVWDAPPVDGVVAGTQDRWLAACIAKCGSIGDVQRRNNLPVTGRYNQVTALAYDAELAAMRAMG